MSEKFKIRLKDSSDEETKYYGLFQKGGSIGQNSNADYRTHEGILLEVYTDPEEAKATAKRYRKWLTPGERSYYGMSYRVIPLKKRDLQNEAVQRMIAGLSNKKIEDADEDEDDITEYRAFAYDDNGDVLDSQVFDYEEDAITFCEDNDYDEVVMYVYSKEAYDEDSPDYVDTVWTK